MPVILKPYRTLDTKRNSKATFYLADCLEVFKRLPRYSTYQDTLTQSDYLQWTGDWVAAAAKALKPEGSLFLNVGTRPSDPWTALDVVQAARSHLRLQNI